MGFFRQKRDMSLWISHDAERGGIYVREVPGGITIAVPRGDGIFFDNFTTAEEFLVQLCHKEQARIDAIRQAVRNQDAKARFKQLRCCA
jgi:hypothetical protein